MKKKPAHGTLFAVPLPDGTFLSGRVTLDIYSCLKRRQFPSDSPLARKGKTMLVEIYSATSSKAEHISSDLLIPGAFVALEELGDSWPIIGRKEVDPRQVEFPESLIGFTHADGESAFECGEISMPFPFSRDMVKKIGTYSTTYTAFLWRLLCLRELGREEEVPEQYKHLSLRKSDLRYSELRGEIYTHLPFPMKLSYYEKQKQMGLHLDRLYE